VELALCDHGEDVIRIGSAASRPLAVRDADLREQRQVDLLVEQYE
jgi:dihydropteroate synthase